MSDKSREFPCWHCGHHHGLTVERSREQCEACGAYVRCAQCHGWLWEPPSAYTPVGTQGNNFLCSRECGAAITRGETPVRELSQYPLVLAGFKALWIGDLGALAEFSNPYKPLRPLPSPRERIERVRTAMHALADGWYLASQRHRETIGIVWHTYSVPSYESVRDYAADLLCCEGEQDAPMYVFACLIAFEVTETRYV